MILTTTDSVEGKRITAYLGIVSGEAIYGANVFRDLFAKVRNFVGGRTGGYEKVLRSGKEAALEDLVEMAKEKGADAVVGIDLEYAAVGNEMLMVSANGTAVRLG
jgi:uncharacterized protein YbjQ (UPF0145 family)